MSANHLTKRLTCAGLFVLAAPFASAMGNRTAADDDAASDRIAPVARVEFANAPAAAAGAAAGNRSGEELYKAVCSACHAAGVAGSPKFGNKGDWAPRIAKGLDALMQSATNGTAKGMPPKGGSDANEVELKRAVVYMADRGGASFKAP
jgi:cytochrome c5